MIARLAALILLCTVYLIHTAEVPQQISLTVVELGGNATFQCPVSEKNVTKEDEATYFCQNGSPYSQSFVNGIFLAVNDCNQQKSVIVKQHPETASVPPGHSVTFQCSLLPKNKENSAQCPGEHSVYWFRAGSGQSHPEVIYTHRNSSDEQEERSCVYSLSKTIRDSSDTGTYYCAVVSCGEILFSKGTQVETKNPVVLLLGLLLACCVTVIVILIFYVKRSRVCEHCKGTKNGAHHPGHGKSTMDQSNDLDDEVAVNYAALDFSSRKMKRGKNKRESPQECVYSVVGADNHNQ